MAWAPLTSDQLAADQQGTPAPAPAPDAPPADAAPQLSEPDVPPPAPTWLGRRKQDFDYYVEGKGRTQYPDAQEFATAYEGVPLTPDEQKDMLSPRWMPDSGAPGSRAAALTAIRNTDLTTDEKAQLDILKKAIPGLELAADKYGNTMLRAPGMTDFAYLNKPGLSKADISGGITQMALAAPMLSPAARAETWAGRVVKGALGGGASSVAQDLEAEQAGSDQGVDTNKALESAAIGGVLPAAESVIAQGVGTTMEKTAQLRNLVQNAANPKAAAQRELQGAFQRDYDAGILNNADRVAQPSDRSIATGFNQDLRTMDFGGANVEAEARKAANFSPSAKDAIMRVFGDRFETQGSRAQDLIQSNMGLARSADQARQQLQQAARQARAPLYKQAYQQGSQGVDSSTIQQLQGSPIFQKAMGRAERTLEDQNATPGWGVWQMNAGSPSRPKYTLAFWDQVKRNLDDYASSALRQGKKSAAGQIGAMSRTLSGELDAQVPLYQQARGTAATFFKADNALEAGENFARGSFNFQDAATQIGRLNAAEKNLFAEGFADKLVQRIQATPDRSNLLNRIAQSPQEQERIKLALGQARWDQMDSFLRLEGIMQKWQGVMGNSTTAQQAAAMMKGYGLPPSGLFTVAAGLHAVAHPTTALIHGAAHAVSKIAGAIVAGGKAAQLRINENVATEVAQLLTSKDPDVFLQGLQQIGKAPIKNAITAFDSMIHGASPFVQRGAIDQQYSKSE